MDSRFFNFYNILVLRKGIGFNIGGTYIIDVNFTIKFKPAIVKKIFVRITDVNGRTLKTSSGSSYFSNLVQKLSFIYKYKAEYKDYINIQLCARNVTQSGIFESYTNSSIDIYYVELI